MVSTDLHSRMRASYTYAFPHALTRKRTQKHTHSLTRTPQLFSIRKAATGGAARPRTTHCGVLEFTADEGHCAIPYWVSKSESAVKVKRVSERASE